MSFARYSPTILSPKHKTLALLCSLENFADVVSEHTTALIPFTLFAVILTPMPVPQISIPFSNSLFDILFASSFAIIG